MYSIYVEMPSGARSRGYEYENVEDAGKAMGLIVTQLKSFNKFTADVVAAENGKDFAREHIENA